MNKIVENNKIKTGFKVPENYFENLSSELFQNVMEIFILPFYLKIWFYGSRRLFF